MKMAKLLVASTMLLGLIFSSASAERETKYFEYGDIFDVRLYDLAGNVLSDFEDNTLVIYISSSCGSCLGMFRTLNRLCTIVGKAVDMMIVFEEEISMDVVEKYELPLDCIATSGDTSLSPITPSALIVSPDNTILYFDTNLETTIDKLFKAEGLKALTFKQRFQL